MSGRYTKLSTRLAGTEPVLHEGIPPHLHRTIQDLIDDVCHARDYRGQAFLRAEILQDIERAAEIGLNWSPNEQFSALSDLKRLVVADADVGLDVLDYIVHALGDTPLIQGLGDALTQAGSAWKVRDDQRGLERRVDATVAASAAAAMAHGKSGEHLRLAWAATYGVTPDPSTAYSQAIKAVETASHVVVTPNDALATLGKIIGELKHNANTFQVVLKGAGDAATKGDTDAISIVRLMTQLLWTGQRDRHGTLDPSQPVSVSQQEAEAAVHLAALLVQWFETGSIHRR